MRADDDYYGMESDPRDEDDRGGGWCGCVLFALSALVVVAIAVAIWFITKPG